MSAIDFGEIVEVLNNKADRDLRNIDAYDTDAIVEYQEPTSVNNYTWYRLYASGWVEQGGLKTNSSATASVTIPIKMADTNYNILIGDGVYASTSSDIRVRYVQNKTTTGFTTSSASGISFSWQVCGKADMTGHPVPHPTREKEEFEHRVIAYQAPTSSNDYTWYRKYADGWVEQGGQATTNSSNPKLITLPVEMIGIAYNINIMGQTGADGYANAAWQVMPIATTTSPKSKTSFYAQASITGYNLFFYWEVKGRYKL